MSDLFARLVERSRGTAVSLEPRLLGTFERSIEIEPQPWGEIDEQVRVSAPRTPAPAHSTSQPPPPVRPPAVEQPPIASPHFLDWEPPSPVRDEVEPIESPAFAPPVEPLHPASPPARPPLIRAIIESLSSPLPEVRLVPSGPPLPLERRPSEKAPPAAAPKSRLTEPPPVPVSRIAPVEVRIGRIELKAAPPPPAPAAASRPARRTFSPRLPLSLRDYLSKRGRR